MGILNLKNTTANKFIKKQLKAAASERKFELKLIKRVGVLAEVSLFQTYDFTKRLSEGLNLEVEDLKVCLFDPSGKDTALEFQRLCSEKDFGFYGNIKSEALNKFVSRDFDLLVNYCDPELLFPKVIMLKSAAKMKAGFEHEANFFNDIAIKVPGNDIDGFNRELLKYLRILNLIK
ncbi:DUF6913 domain-containing protein [Lutimonas sp.]|jgi:hypothetical protein|uniref:DUF6913 domain-containing protein n=1 Tax=Lutimonas sp. TaxID=1872403 RepID=UPI003C78AFE2